MEFVYKPPWMPNEDVLGERIRQTILGVVGTTHPEWDSLDDVPIDALVQEITHVVREYACQPMLELTGPFIVESEDKPGRYIINVQAVIHEVAFLQYSVVIDARTDKIRASNSVREYVEFMESGRQVARSEIKNGDQVVEISTVFLGHARIRWTEPGVGTVHFETAVRGHPNLDPTRQEYLIVKRYASLDDARSGHQKVVGKIAAIQDKQRIGLLDLLTKKAWQDHIAEQNRQDLENVMFEDL